MYGVLLQIMRIRGTREQQCCRSRLRVATRFYQHLAGTLLKEVWRVAAGTGGNAFNYFMKVNMMVFKPNGKIRGFFPVANDGGIVAKSELPDGFGGRGRPGDVDLGRIFGVAFR